MRGEKSHDNYQRLRLSFSAVSLKADGISNLRKKNLHVQRGERIKIYLLAFFSAAILGFLVAPPEAWPSLQRFLHHVQPSNEER